MRAHALTIAATALVVYGATAFFVSRISASHVVSTIRIHREMADVFDLFHHAEELAEVASSFDLRRRGDGSFARNRRRGHRGIPHGERERANGLAGHSPRRSASVAHRELACGDAQVAITYRLRMDGSDTVFERDMQYQFNRLWLIVLDPLFIRRRMERESEQALVNAKQILEH